MKLSTNFVKDYVDIPEEIDLKRLAEKVKIQKAVKITNESYEGA